MRRVGAVLLAVVVTVIAGGMLLRRLAPRLAAARLSEALGVPVEIDRVRPDWGARSVELRGVRIGADGAAPVRARSVVVGAAVLIRGRGALDGTTVRRLVLPGLPPLSGRARRLRTRRDDVGVVLDGVFEQGQTVVTIVGGRIDAASARPRAARMTAEHLLLGEMVVERAVAEDVRPDELPARLRARVRVSDGTIRLRWDGPVARLDVRLARVPLRALVGEPFRDASLRGGVTSGLVRVGRVPGTIEARLRVGPTRLERGGETWLGWSALAADVGRLEIRARRLVRSSVALDGLVALVRHGPDGTWPVAGWDDWLGPLTSLRAAGLWAWVDERFGTVASDPAMSVEAAMVISTGTVTLIDTTVEPAARLGLHDVDARGRYEADVGVEGHLDARVGDGGSVSVILDSGPVPRAAVAMRGLPTAAVGGWGTLGSGLLGLPLGRMLELAGDRSAVDLALTVTGDPSEKRFGLATRAAEAVVGTLRDRVVDPLLATVVESRHDDAEVLVLPALAVGRQGLTEAAIETLDRLVVLLHQFPELGVGLEGRFGPAETEADGAERAAVVVRHLEERGVGARVIGETVAPGDPGVGVVVESAAS